MKPALCVLLFIFIANAQAEEISARPKIGLVLSGGGARGLAHIGVLEWLEQNHIPIDYIGGTSMGGLIGGMYALGMSPAEIREFLETVNWVSTFGTGVRYQDLSFRRKEDRRDFPVELELGLKDGIYAPPGLSTGVEVNLMIDRITLPYSTIDDFSALPIPFFCMGTDLINAKEVVMDSGLLSTAMRATMSIPGIFPPVNRKGDWLVDGGVLNNIPTDVMRKRADVIIAVNAGTPLGDEKAIRSLFGVATQTIMVMMAGNERRNLDLADIVIAPDLGNLAITDFANVQQVADKGFPAAEDVAQELRPYALEEASWQEYKDAIAARIKTTLPVPASVRVTGVQPNAAEEITSYLSEHAERPVDIQALEKDLKRLCGEGRYQSADYGFTSDPQQKPVLEIRITEKTYAPPTLNFSLGIAGSDISDLNFGFGTRLTVYDLFSYGTEWRSDLNLGINSGIFSEFYRPFGRRGFLSRLGLYRQGFFGAGRVYYDRGNRNLFAGGERVAEFGVNNFGAGADFGYESWNHELRIGAVYERVDADLSTGTGPIEQLKGNVKFGRIRWAYDGANSATIPTRGMRFVSEARYYVDAPLIEDHFPWLNIETIFYKPVRTYGTLFARVKLGTTFDQEAAPAQKFTLGGPFDFGAFDEAELVGNNKVLLSGGYYHEILRLPAVIGRSIWAIGWYDLGGAFDHFNDAGYVHQGSIGMIMDTKVGPFAIIVAYGEGGNSNIYFSFGRFF